MLAEASGALSSADRKELDWLERQSRPVMPLWDGQEILPRPRVQAIDDGDNAPDSWDQPTNASMPTSPAQGQNGSGPHTSAQGAVGGASPLHETATTGISYECNQSGSTSPAAKSTAASVAELEAKRAMLQQRIATKRAAAKAAAKAHKASVDPSTASSSTADDHSVETQARSMPPHAETFTAGPPGPAPMPVNPPKIPRTVCSSSTALLHSSNTHEGIEPASSHSHQQLRVLGPRPGSSSSTTPPVSDYGHSQADATASSCRNELPGGKGQTQAVGRHQAATSTASGDTQLAASIDSKQDGQIGTDTVANELPAAATQTAVTGSDLGLSHQGPVTPSTPSPQASLPSVHHNHDEQQAQNNQDSQAHLDPSGWLVLLRSQGNTSDEAATVSVGSRVIDNNSLHAAVNPPLPGQQQEEPGPGSQSNRASCAVAAMEITAGRVEVIQRHAPLVLQDRAAMEIHRNPKPAGPVDSGPPDECMARELPAAQAEQTMTSSHSIHLATMASQAYPKQPVNDVQLQAGSFLADGRDSASPMDIDDTSRKFHTHSNQPSDEAPQAVFGHEHCSSFSERGSCCYDISRASAICSESAMWLAGDQKDAMDIDESMY